MFCTATTRGLTSQVKSFASEGRSNSVTLSSCITEYLTFLRLLLSFRRRIFDEGNWMDESLHYAMDFEFFVRLASRGYRFKHGPEADGGLSLSTRQQNLHGLTQAVRRDQHYVMHLYSPVLRKMRTPVTRLITTAILRSCAGALRYSEKLARGYYLNQFRPATLNS